jgi:phosphatidate cytidylyltransferase
MLELNRYTSLDEAMLIASFFEFDALDRPVIIFVLVVLVSLAILLFIGQILRRQPESNFDPAIVRTFNKRVSAWLTICVILVVALLFVDQTFTVVLFGIVSFWALREFITMTPTRRGDHRTLFWVFFLFTPLQYVMVGKNLYQLYTIVIPVYASLFIAGRIAFADDHKRFLERIAIIQFGLLICVYSLSHAPALLNLNLYSWNTVRNEWLPWEGKPSGLLFFFIVVVQVSDMLHFVWDRLAGKHVIAPSVNATKTWEGLIGAACCTAAFGTLIQLLLPVTPFTWYGAGFMALIISVMASSGSMTMSAIKRDRGVKDYGTLVQGHAGVLDKIDSLCFAAPIFFHLTRYFLEVLPLS